MDYLKEVEEVRDRTTEERDQFENLIREELVLAGVPKEHVTLHLINRSMEIRSSLDRWSEDPGYFLPTFDEMEMDDESDEPTSLYI